MVIGCNRSKRVKRRNYALFSGLGGRPVSMVNWFTQFTCGCGLHYNVLSGLSVKQEVKGLMTNYITMHYPCRKKTGSLASSLVLQLVGFASS